VSPLRRRACVEGRFSPRSPEPPPAISSAALDVVRMAEGIREGKPVSPDFEVAVNRHELLDSIQKVSDTGFRQVL